MKHVLLLTDGQSYGGDFDGIARRMARERITMSTVGVGSDADGRLLSGLANLGGGRYYAAVRAQSLPLIFDRETRLASRRALVWLDGSGFARGSEYAGAKDALTWAAMTYVSAALAALVQFLYLLFTLLGNRN